MCICKFGALRRCRCRCRCTLSRSKDRLTKVPPVGFEPTLRTLLGGRPLPLGYGGALIITRFCYLSLNRGFSCARQNDGDLYIAGILPQVRGNRAKGARLPLGRRPAGPGDEPQARERGTALEGGPRAASPGKPDSGPGREQTGQWPDNRQLGRTAAVVSLACCSGALLRRVKDA
jgi:hypothetical protein